MSPGQIAKSLLQGPLTRERLEKTISVTIRTKNTLDAVIAACPADQRAAVDLAFDPLLRAHYERMKP